MIIHENNLARLILLIVSLAIFSFSFDYYRKRLKHLVEALLVAIIPVIAAIVVIKPILIKLSWL